MAKDVPTISARNQSGQALQAYDPFVETMKVSYTATAGLSSAMPDKTGMVRIFCTTLCHVAKGSAPVATTDSMPLAALTEYYFYAEEGEKFSFVQNASGGNAFISVCK